MKYLLLLITFTFSLTTFSQEIIEWRGINRTGHYPSENLLKEWPEAGPKLLLSIDNLESSYSSVVVKNDIMYTTSVDGQEEMLTALNMDGTQLWNTIYGRSFDKTFSPARCTPTIEGEYAYVISGLGDIACININNGKIIWSFDAFTKFEGKIGMWGTAESPLIVGNKLIYTPGGDKTTVVALNKSTGETVWMSESLNDVSAYCSPIVIERNGIKLILTVTSKHILGLNAENGKILWKQDYFNIDENVKGNDINPVSPLVKGNEIFVTSGYNHVGVMLEMKEDLSDVKIKWITENLDTHHGGVIEHDGYIYGSNFTNIVKGHWLCLDWNTGEVKYEEPWLGNKGSIIFSDGMLICYDERKGNVALVEANPNEFKIKSIFQMKEGKGPHWSHPSIFDGKLFIRHGNALNIYQISEK